MMVVHKNGLTPNKNLNDDNRTKIIAKMDIDHFGGICPHGDYGKLIDMVFSKISTGNC